MDVSCSCCGLKISIFVIFVTIVFLLWRKKYRLSKNHNLYGKHVLVTGGSSGIGKWVAIETTKVGADVTIVARDSKKLEIAVEEIKKYVVHENQRITYLSLDVSKNYHFIEQTLHELEKEFGPIFMLFCCAGTAFCGTLEQLPIEDVNYLINLNFLGTLHVVKALVPGFKRRKEGHITITSSQAALVGIYGYSTYCGTKFALRGLAECLHMELQPYNVNVTLAFPPDTDTPGFANEEKTKPEATREISQKGGFYEPSVVASQIVKDVFDKKFFSTLSFDGFILSILCSGMSPASSIFKLLLESFLMGIFRLVSHYIHYDMAKIVAKHEKIPI